MNTEVTKPVSFEERMFQKIRSDMGDLMTDEELKEVLAKAVEKAFFQDRRIHDPRGYGRDQITEPLFVELIREELKQKIAELLKQWLVDNSERVEELLNEVLKNNAANFVANAFGDLMQGAFADFGYRLREKLLSKNIIL